MFLIVGLGNPGKKYERTRHNIGFRAVDELKSLNLKNVILAKPKTFMNLSGKSVKNLLKTYKIKANNLIVVHDDIDLPLGKIKIVKSRGAAGHKGVESIMKELKSKNFIRFRVGVKPKAYNLKPKTLDRFVLQKFNKDEEKIVKEVIKKTAGAVEMMANKGLGRAQSVHNK